jgi:hypothetical protein
MMMQMAVTETVRIYLKQILFVEFSLSTGLSFLMALF